MARKKKTTTVDVETGEVLVESTVKVRSIQDKKTEMQKLREENEKLKKQIAAIMWENMILRKQAKQPEAGPLLPNWINKNTVEKLNDPDWYYGALDNKGIPMVMEKETGRWIRRSRANYIRYNGPIPDDWLVAPIDGNNHNLDIDNWAAMPKKDFFKETGYSFESSLDGKSHINERVNLKTGEPIEEQADE